MMVNGCSIITLPTSTVSIIQQQPNKPILQIYFSTTGREAETEAKMKDTFLAKLFHDYIFMHKVITIENSDV